MRRENMNFMQRMLGPVINFLVERYFPTGSFYGNSGGLRIFERQDREDDCVLGRTAALMLINRVHESGSHRLDVNVTQHTSNGILTGDWQVTIRRVNMPKLPEKKELEHV